MKKILGTILLVLFLSQLQAQSLYDLNTLRSIYIEFENPDWENILINNWHAQNGERQLATLEMDGIIYDSVAIRYKGNATFSFADQLNNPKKPLNIDMDDFISDQDLLGFNKVKLSNALTDPTITRDVMGLRIYGDYMPSPESNWIKVYINGDYIGLYPNTESINKSFLKKHFGYKKGAFFKCDPFSQFGSNNPWTSSNLAWYGPDSTDYYSRYNLKSNHGWEELLELINILNNSPDDLPNILNIDRVLWYLAVSTVMANYDSYNGFFMHNYYLYQNKSGLFQIIPWDVSEIYVGVLLGFPGGIPDKEIYGWDIFNENDRFNEKRPLVDFVANHPIYRKQYLAHIRTLIKETLDEMQLSNKLVEMHSIIETAHTDDINSIMKDFFVTNLTTDIKFGTLKVAGILSAARKRKAYLLTNREISLTSPVISQVDRNPEFPKSGEQTSITAVIENGTKVDLMVTVNKYASHFIAISMLDDGLHGDGVAGDGVYGAFIPFTDLDDEVKYYIRAQNTDAMVLDPQRAEFVFHKYRVGQTVAVDNFNTKKHQIIVFPNPLSGQVKIKLNFKNEQQEISLRIYTEKGDLVNNEIIQLVNDEYLLNLEHLHKGIYFIQLGDSEMKKIVKH